MDVRVRYRDLLEESDPRFSISALPRLKLDAYAWSDGNWRLQLSADFVGENRNEGTWVSTMLEGAYLLVDDSGRVLSTGFESAQVQVWLSGARKRAALEKSVVVPGERIRRASYVFVYERWCRWAVTMRTIKSYERCYRAGGLTNVPSLRTVAERFANERLSRIPLGQVPGEVFDLGSWKGLRLR